jgi:methyl coenzyme M reductase gamma subunit
MALQDESYDEMDDEDVADMLGQRHGKSKRPKIHPSMIMNEEDLQDEGIEDSDVGELLNDGDGDGDGDG